MVASLCSLFQPGLSYCLLVAPSSPAPPLQQGLGNPALIGRTYPWRRAPAEQTEAAGLRVEWFLPPPPCPPTAMRDLCSTQSQACWQERIWKEMAARVAWKICYSHKYPKEGPVPRKRLQRTPLRLALGAGPLAATSSPESREVQDGGPETKGVWDQLSRGVGVQGPPPKGDEVWETRRAARGPAVQSRPEGLGMRQVPPSTLQLLFQGISHDGQGRASYLRERHRQKPEEKFLYPILSSWEYGWHMGKGDHHLATPGLCRQARPFPSALSLITPQAPACAWGSPFSKLTAHLHTFRPLHIFISPPGMYLLPLPLLANFHVSPPLGSPLKVLQADLRRPCANTAFRVYKSTGPTLSPFLEYPSGLEPFGFQNFLVNFIKVLPAPSLGLVLCDRGINEQMNEGRLGNEALVWNQEVQVQILAPSLASCVSSSKSLHFTGPPFPHLKNGTLLVPAFLCHRVLGKSNGKAQNRNFPHKSLMRWVGQTFIRLTCDAFIRDSPEREIGSLRIPALPQRELANEQAWKRDSA